MNTDVRQFGKRKRWRLLPSPQRFGDLRHDFVDVGEFRRLAAFTAGEVKELSNNRVHLLDVVNDGVARLIFAD